MADDENTDMERAEPAAAEETEVRYRGGVPVLIC